MDTKQPEALRLANMLDSVSAFWQQHTKSDALSMTMAELHADAEQVIRAARGAAQAAPSNGALAAPAQPVAWALQWPDDSRLNLITVFDTQLEATDYLKSCSDGVVVVPLYAAPQPTAQALDALKQVCAIAVSAAKTNSRDIADWREDIDRIAAIAAQKENHD